MPDKHDLKLNLQGPNLKPIIYYLDFALSYACDFFDKNLKKKMYLITHKNRAVKRVK